MKIVFAFVVVLSGYGFSATANLIVATEEYVVSLNPHRMNVTLFSVDDQKFIGELVAPEGANALYLDQNTVFFRCPGTLKLPCLTLPKDAQSIDAFQLATRTSPIMITDLSVHEGGLTIYNEPQNQYVTYANDVFSPIRSVMIPQSMNCCRVCLCKDKFFIWPKTIEDNPHHHFRLKISVHVLYMYDIGTETLIKSNGTFLYDIDQVEISGGYIVTKGWKAHHLMIFDLETLKLLYTLNFPKGVQSVHLDNGLEEAVYCFTDGYQILNHFNNKTLREQTVSALSASQVMPGIIIYAYPFIQNRWVIVVQDIYRDKRTDMVVEHRPVEVIVNKKHIFSKLHDTTALGLLKLP